MNEIVFSKTFDIPDEFAPQPAVKVIPNWYKDSKTYENDEKIPNGDGKTTATIKKCMPVFDAMTSGYILFTYVDLYVSQRPLIDPNTGLEVENETMPYFEWPSLNPLGWHPVYQAEKHPGRKNLDDAGSYPKWINPWSIKTPAGYSTLVVPPLHREAVFTILPGMVDTDTYTPAINFPFVLNDWKFKGYIPAGTPMAQVIPIKRDSWQMRFGTEEDILEQTNKLRWIRAKFFDAYKSEFRQVKEYK